MCFGLLASTCVAAVAYAVAPFLKCHSLTLRYFGFMEVLQALQYASLYADLPACNAVFTTLGYVHVSFQPLFLNLYHAHASENQALRDATKWTTSLCVVAGVLMVLRLRGLVSSWDNFYEWSNQWHYDAGCPCRGYSDFFEANETISYIGPTGHVAWKVNLHGFTYFYPTMNIHFFLSFVLPLVVARTVTRSMVVLCVGLGFSFLLSTDRNEAPPMWCLVHPLIILSAVFGRLCERWCGGNSRRRPIGTGSLRLGPLVHSAATLRGE